jgi:DNA repair protein RadC
LIIHDFSEAAALFDPMFRDSGEVERIAAAFLDERRELIELAQLAEGVEAGGELPKGRIVGQALRLGALGLVVGRSKPGSGPEPSREDVESTRELADMASRLGMRLHDVIIWTSGETCSLRQLGLL